MTRRLGYLLVLLALPAAATGAALGVSATAGASAKSAGSTTSVTGTLALSPLGTHSVRQIAASEPPTAPTKANEQLVSGPNTDILSRTLGGAATLPTPQVGSLGGVGGGGPTSQGFLGITGAQQASANGANDLEPPDQGLCSNGTDVVEVVNNAYAVYTSAGTPLTPVIAASALFGVPNESTGYFTADPRCYYDAATGRWFLTELGIPGYFSGKGHSTKSYQLIAVSESSDPTGSYVAFAIPTTDPSDPGCPCFGDYPMIGADANGFYVTTNEFSIYRPNFNGVQLYAMSKQGLVAAADGAVPPVVVHIGGLASPFAGEGVGDTYHLSPALTPQDGAFDAANDGTEYFTMSDAFPTSASDLAVYALTNTASLDSPSPALALSSTVVGTQAYAYPASSVAVVQQASPTTPPLASAIQTITNSASPPPEGVLQSDFDAVQETTYTGGNLYTALDTVVSASYSPTYTTDVGTTAAEWFHLSVSDGGALSSKVVSQGVYGISGQSLIYPDLVVNGAGAGDLVFTLTGPNYYPSAAFIAFSGDALGKKAAIAAPGSGPEDGFTCYAYYVGTGYGGCRWGDYSGGVAIGNTVWLATEYVPPASTRDNYTNWGTFVFHAAAG